jgi:hypothetical protein
LIDSLFNPNIPSKEIAMPTLHFPLTDNWNLYCEEGAPSQSAFMTAHGSYENSDGFTKLPSPSNLYFYTFHTDPMYSVEIFQLIDYKDRLKFGDKEEIINCKPKEPTSILRKGYPCWNYHFSAWDTNATQNFLERWGKNPASDLLMLEAPSGGYFSNTPRSTLDGLFEALSNFGLAYETIHFCSCRSVEGKGGIRAKHDSTKPLYESANPYWR